MSGEPKSISELQTIDVSIELFEGLYDCEWSGEVVDVVPVTLAIAREDYLEQEVEVLRQALAYYHEMNERLEKQLAQLKSKQEED